MKYLGSLGLQIDERVLLKLSVILKYAPPVYNPRLIEKG